MSDRQIYFIAFSGDPRKDCETYKRYVGVEPVRPIPGEDVVRVITHEEGDVHLTREQASELKVTIHRRMLSDESCGHPFDEDLSGAFQILESAMEASHE